MTSCKDYKNAGVLGVPNGSTMVPGEGILVMGSPHLRPYGFFPGDLARLSQRL